MNRQAGFSILTLLTLSIALVAALAFVLVGSGPNVSGQMNAQRTSQLVAQAQLIIQRIVKCATDYSEFNTAASGYPAGSGVPVANLLCPANSQNLWSGVDGVYLPSAPASFGPWQYTNDTGTGRISIAITSSQPAEHAFSISATASKIGPAATATANSLTIKILE